MFSEHLVCLLAAGSLRRDPLELLFELRRGQFPPLETIARIDDFLDIELKDIALYFFMRVARALAFPGGLTAVPLRVGCGLVRR